MVTNIELYQWYHYFNIGWLRPFEFNFNARLSMNCHVENLIIFEETKGEKTELDVIAWVFLSSRNSCRLFLKKVICLSGCISSLLVALNYAMNILSIPTIYSAILSSKHFFIWPQKKFLLQKFLDNFGKCIFFITTKQLAWGWFPIHSYGLSFDGYFLGFNPSVLDWHITQWIWTSESVNKLTNVPDLSWCL